MARSAPGSPRAPCSTARRGGRRGEPFFVKRPESLRRPGRGCRSGSRREASRSSRRRTQAAVEKCVRRRRYRDDGAPERGRRKGPYLARVELAGERVLIGSAGVRAVDRKVRVRPAAPRRGVVECVGRRGSHAGGNDVGGCVDAARRHSVRRGVDDARRCSVGRGGRDAAATREDRRGEPPGGEDRVTPSLRSIHCEEPSAAPPRTPSRADRVVAVDTRVGRPLRPSRSELARAVAAADFRAVSLVLEREVPQRGSVEALRLVHQAPGGGRHGHVDERFGRDDGANPHALAGVGAERVVRGTPPRWGSAARSRADWSSTGWGCRRGRGSPARAAARRCRRGSSRPGRTRSWHRRGHRRPSRRRSPCSHRPRRRRASRPRLRRSGVRSRRPWRRGHRRSMRRRERRPKSRRRRRRTRATGDHSLPSAPRGRRPGSTEPRGRHCVRRGSPRLGS